MPGDFVTFDILPRLVYNVLGSQASDMSAARKLYQLQEIDLELESNEQALARITSQLGESQAIVAARDELNGHRQRLEEVKTQQRSLEWEIDDLSAKLKSLEQKLYGGRIASPKELTNLEHEANGLKDHRRQVEDRVLELMEEASEAEAKLAALANDLIKLEAEWQLSQQRLLADAERHKTAIAGLKQRRQAFVAGIGSPAVSLYEEVKKQKGRAVAKVEAGTCRACGLTLSTAQLQQAKGERVVQCSNCGRILFFV